MKKQKDLTSNGTNFNDMKNILVTGAGGFIGGRIVETILLNEEYQDINVFAGIRRWQSAARLGRYKTNFRMCDIMKPDSLENAIDGIDYVIHCAVGPGEIAYKGTENVLEACHKKGIRVTHISTVDVYGKSSGVVDEGTPLTYTGNPYGDSKIKAEEICQNYIQQGLSLNIIRPTVVYGPFSDLWTVRFAERLKSGQWGVFEKIGSGYCNLIFIDDLAEVTIKVTLSEDIKGEAFNINGDEIITWNEYFKALNDSLGLPPLTTIDVSKSELRSKISEPIRAAAKFGMNKFGKTIQKLYTSNDLAKSLMQKTQSQLKVIPNKAELNLYQKTAKFSNKKMKKMLGFDKITKVEDGIKIGSKWIKHHGII